MNIGNDLTIRFTADISRAVDNIDRLIRKINEVRSIETTPKFSGLLGPDGRAISNPVQAVAATTNTVAAATVTAGKKAEETVERLVRKQNLFQGLLSRIPSSTSLWGGHVSGLARMANLFGYIGSIGPGAMSAIAVAAGPAAVAVGAVVANMMMLKKAFSMGNLVEGAKLQLEVVTGSAETARRMMKEAIRYSMITPFKPAETFMATSLLAQRGYDPFKKGAYGLGKDQNVMQIIAGLGSYRDMHGNQMGMQRAVMALTMGDRRYLKAYGAPVLDAYKRSLGSGLTGSPEQVQAFVKELGKVPQVMNMAQKHSESMAGLWSTISGFAEEFWVNFSGANEKQGVFTFWNQLKDMLKDIRDAGTSFMSGAGEEIVWLGAMFMMPFKAVYDILSVIWDIIGGPIVFVLKLVWYTVKAIFNTVKGVFDITIGALKGIVGFFIELVKVFFSLSGASNVFVSIINGMRDFALWIEIAFMFLGIAIKGIFVEAREYIEDWKAGIHEFINDVKSMFPWIEKLVNAKGWSGYQFSKEGKSKREMTEEEEKLAEKEAAEKGLVRNSDGTWSELSVETTDAWRRRTQEKQKNRADELRQKAINNENNLRGQQGPNTTNNIIINSPGYEKPVMETIKGRQ